VSADHVDVLIVGAGLSGIGAGHQLHARFPDRTYAILESRSELGGTWSLFTYPGVRSDSDMHTLGYRFRPWTDATAIAGGPAILDYLRDTAREGDVERHIRYGKRVIRANWSTPESIWTVEVRDINSGQVSRMTCRFLFLCCGYYDYDEPYAPQIPGIEEFSGPVVHPQFWPADLDYAGKSVVVIGSGATAVTLVPAMAGVARHVTMLQRSPTYIVAMPGTDRTAQRLGRWLPKSRVAQLVRWRNIVQMVATYRLSRRWPSAMRRLIRKSQERFLPGNDIDTHLTPTYQPWDQRLCVVPNGDLFRALRAGTASIVTDTIDQVTASGIALSSGQELEADIIVTATGLNLLAFGGIEVLVDGAEVVLSEHMSYRSVMLNDVPNLAYAMGYTNASWTLKIDLTYDYLWRLFERMDDVGATWCVPRLNGVTVGDKPFLDFQAGYVLRAVDRFPKAGDRAPWKLRMNYVLDVFQLGRGSVDDGTLEFGTGDSGRGASDLRRVAWLSAWDSSSSTRPTRSGSRSSGAG